MLAFLRRPLDDLMDAMEPILRAPRSKPALLAAILSLVCTWLLYVPVHELLHVFGLVATGGSITALELQPIYGGHLLAEIFPFVVPGGEYAGRLTEFDTYGSDSTYLAADFAPYLLAILGVPLLRLCALRRRPILFAPKSTPITRTGSIRAPRVRCRGPHRPGADHTGRGWSSPTRRRSHRPPNRACVISQPKWINSVRPRWP